MAVKKVNIYHGVHEENTETWRIWVHDMWCETDGGYTSNDRYNTEHYIVIPDDALNKHILAALREEGFIRKYERWYISIEDENHIYFETRNGERMIELERVVIV